MVARREGWHKQPLIIGRRKNWKLDKEQYERIYRSVLPDVCLDPNHEPASMVYRSGGTYEHRCPACGHIEIFQIPTWTL